MSAGNATLRSVADLVAAGLVRPEAEPALAEVALRYAIAVSPAMAELIDRSDPHDPIARQLVPDARELQRLAHERDDPIGDGEKSPVPGLVHRYADRVLLKVAHVCAIYCRFCFRRETVGPAKGASLSETELAAALDYIRARPAIWEVILTGGDPLVLSPRRIAELTAALETIPHVKVLRWHTRLPVAAPERITADLVAALKPRHGRAVYVALHANHPRELTPAARDALARLADAGLSLVSQSVLLNGVNDDVATLEALMRGFVEARVKPYYLHHGDLAPGTSHLRTTLAHGQALIAALRGRLSGLAMPTYVLDIPGAHGKVPAGPSYVSATASGTAVTDPRGGHHTYSDTPAVGDGGDVGRN
jgi:lysine 2,3-aminomutase